MSSATSTRVALSTSARSRGYRRRRGAFGLPEALIVAAALLVDAAMFAWSYDQPRRLVVGMTVIHAVITTLLGIVLLSGSRCCSRRGRGREVVAVGNSHPPPTHGSGGAPS